MRRKILAVLMIFTVILQVLAGCGSQKVQEHEAVESPEHIRVGALKGPTSMGLVSMMERDDIYTFTMVTAADELLAMMAKKELDIALLPANVASVLYEKTSGEILVVDINTLGVLYTVSGDPSIDSVEKLKGKKVYLTGKGTTPDYVMQYLLDSEGMTGDDITLEYKSEAAEVAAVLKEDPQAVGILPQPFATVACAQNEQLQMVIDLTEEWDRLQTEGNSRLVTGVTVADKEFLKQYPDAVTGFLEEHKESTDWINADPAAAAKLVVKAGIIEKEAIAEKAIPYCNITCITGTEMKEALQGYLQVLYQQAPDSVGGKLPDDGFYYLG